MMDENIYLGSNSSFDLESSLSPQGKYLPHLIQPMEEARNFFIETNCLNIETSSPLDQSLEPLMHSKTTKSSERKEFRRTSLYRQFDPLHSFSQMLESNPEQNCDNFTEALEMPNKLHDVLVGDIRKAKVISNVPNYSSENVLMSFESPKKLSMNKSKQTDKIVSTKKYTEKEFNQILQAHKLHLQGKFFWKHYDLKTSFTEKDQALEHKLSLTAKINNLYSRTLEELINIVENMSSYNKDLEDKIKSKMNENEKLKKDIATSKEDLSEWENKFSDFHKWYEKGKSMLKSYKENEKVLEINIGSAQLALDEKDKIFDLLETSMQEIMDKARMEIESVKKSGDSEIAMLEVQLKKAEMKIYSLENNFKQVGLQNDEISNICADLMSKIGK